MAVFGKNGLIRKQEIAFAKKLLVWKYEKAGSALPDEKVLSAHAKAVVDEAHVIARKSGKNILEIMKETVKDLRRKY